ncbi:MAG: hypothetical protein Q9187_002773 [Circinaria calcarea]
MSAPPPLQIPPGIQDDDRGSAIIVIFWVQASVAMAVVAARFWARISIKTVGVDDWLMLFTLFLFVCWTSALTYSATLGGFRHIYFLTPTQGRAILKINYIIQVVIVFAYTTGKAAVGFLVLRIMGPNSFYRKWLIYGIMILTFVVGSLDCIFTYVQCENILADVVLACVPGTIIYGLNMELKKRISLCILLGLGLVAAVCGIIKTNFLAALSSRADLTWATYNLIVWSGAELFVIIVCGSIPPLKTFWDRFVAKKGYLSYGSRKKQERHNSDNSGMNSYEIKSSKEDPSIMSQSTPLAPGRALRPNQIKTTTDISVDYDTMRDHEMV